MRREDWQAVEFFKQPVMTDVLKEETYFKMTWALKKIICQMHDFGVDIWMQGVNALCLNSPCVISERRLKHLCRHPCVMKHLDQLDSTLLSHPQTNIQDQAARDKALQQMASMSSAQIVSASAIHNKALAGGLGGLQPVMSGGPARSSYPGAPSVRQRICHCIFGLT